MKIEIWSDVACPFCYIGKRKFESALAEFAQRNEIEISWKSFQLDPTPQRELPAETDIYQYLATRKGMSYAESKSLHDHVTKMAQEVGLVYNFDQAKLSNTFDASRLLHFATQFGKQSEAKEKLFLAHFTLGLDVADHKVLIRIGEEIGLEGKAVADMLNSDALRDEVLVDIAEAQQVGVTGVPFFVFDRKYAVSGAQSSAVFLQTLQKAFSERQVK